MRGATWHLALGTLQGATWHLTMQGATWHLALSSAKWHLIGCRWRDKHLAPFGVPNGTVIFNSVALPQAIIHRKSFTGRVAYMFINRLKDTVLCIYIILCSLQLYSNNSPSNYDSTYRPKTIRIA